MFIDTHAHLEMKTLSDDTIGVIQRAKAAGVEKILTIGTDVDSSKNALQLARKYPEVLATVGAHPEMANKVDLSVYQQLISLARNPEIIAIGEIGLDYYRLEKSGKFSHLSSEKEQIRLFEQMIDIAIENEIPIIVHSREAVKDTLDIINSYKSELVGGVFHCFSYSLGDSRRFLDTNFYLSFTNIITYKKNDYLRDVIKYTSLDRILIETDAPFLPPEDRRGQTSEPRDVVSVAQAIAQIKNISIQEVGQITSQNAKKLFKL